MLDDLGMRPSLELVIRTFAVLLLCQKHQISQRNHLDFKHLVEILTKIFVLLTTFHGG
jgi:hypothetical protein